LRTESTIIRIFDALNDPRNLETAIRACKKEGGHAQGTISYTLSPVHNLDYFVRYAKQLEDMGSDSICIKDMAGLLLPYDAYNLVKALKKSVKLPIQVHCPYTSGVGSMTYLKAIEAGADVVDCAISPMAMGTSQPPTEPLVATLKGTKYDTGYDLSLLSEIAEYYTPLKEKYIKSGLLDIKVMGVDVNTLVYQVPGGMLSNLVSQLKQAGKMDLFQDVLKEVPKVREDLGYPPLVTPTSQIVGTQAVMNVLMGERYKMVPKKRGRSSRESTEKLPPRYPTRFGKRYSAARSRSPAVRRPAAARTGENPQRDQRIPRAGRRRAVLPLFPQVAEDFFKTRQAKKYALDSSTVSYADKTHPV
jgi:oxaloacetate decarboxylase alpha subunit